MSSSGTPGNFGADLRFTFATTCRLARPPCRSRPGFHPADGDFYLRAFDGLVARSAAGYHYRDNWAIFSGGSFPARTPTSIAATAYRTGQAQLTHPALGERFTLSPTESWRSARSGEPSQTSDAGPSGETACSPRPALCV